MASSSRRFLSPQDTDRTVDEPVTHSKTSTFDSDDESSVINNLPVHEFLMIDKYENEDVTAHKEGVVYRVWHILPLLHGRIWKIM
jgi:hypothetical protein